MRKSTACFFATLLLLCLHCADSPQRSDTAPVISEEARQFLGAGEYTGDYWPTTGWRTCRPEEVGMDSDKLALAYEYAADTEINTEGLVIVKDGYIVGEAYFGDFTQEERHYSYSVGKSFTGALIGIAIDRGLIDGVEEKVYQYYPQWQTPETPDAKKEITIEHLLTMTSGLQWNEDDYYTNTQNNDAYIMHRQPNQIEYVLNKPMAHPPGTYWYYSTGNSQLLSGVIEGATGKTAYLFGLQHLLEPIGLSDIIWDHDAAGHTVTGAGIRATVREFAKFGYLYLKNGTWDGQQIVSLSWVEQSRQSVSEQVPYYGYQWWLKPALRGYANSIVPDNTMIAWGIFTQQIFVIPEKGIVIARVGNDPHPSDDQWDEVEFLTLVLNSIKE